MADHRWDDRAVSGDPAGTGFPVAAHEEHRHVQRVERRGQRTRGDQAAGAGAGALAVCSIWGL